MFHLLVSGSGWSDTRDTISSSRVFEYTDEEISTEFMIGSKFNASKISSIPALFISEIQGTQPTPARIGIINKIAFTGKDVSIHYTFDATLPSLTNFDLKDMADDLQIADFEFTRTHWAIKNVDLFEIILRRQQRQKPTPTIFDIDENWTIDPNLLSVMMPFSSDFDSVFSVIKRVAKKAEMVCLRGDNIWDKPEIIQDVFSLIYKSRIVICDLSKRNPNVFYEAGIAHTLGREVILITQTKDDVPFDLRHLRYVEYKNDKAGKASLSRKLSQKINSILAVK